jgi:hypothetical protein
VALAMGIFIACTAFRKHRQDIHAPTGHTI